MGSGLERCLVWVFHGLNVRDSISISDVSPMYLAHVSRPKSKRCEVEREGGGREGFGRIRGGDWGLMEAENGFQATVHIVKVNTEY